MLMNTIIKIHMHDRLQKEERVFEAGVVWLLFNISMQTRG